MCRQCKSMHWQYNVPTIATIITLRESSSQQLSTGDCGRNGSINTEKLKYSNTIYALIRSFSESLWCGFHRNQHSPNRLLGLSIHYVDSLRERQISTIQTNIQSIIPLSTLGARGGLKSLNTCPRGLWTIPLS